MARANRAVLGDFSIRIRAMPKPACRHRRGGDWPAPSSSGHLQFFFHVLGLAYTVRSLYSAHPLALKILFASAFGDPKLRCRSADHAATQTKGHGAISHTPLYVRRIRVCISVRTVCMPVSSAVVSCGAEGAAVQLGR